MGLSITRRYSLKAIAATAMCAPAVLGSATRSSAAPLPKLPNLSAGEALLLRPADRNYERYQAPFNARTMLRPQLRALCRSAKSVAVMVDWCRSNNLPFALRGGGHSFEGLSESRSVVIDTRLMNDVTIQAGARSARVAAGATLGTIYKAVAAHNMAIPAGACLTVGVAGQALGGGTGYLGRAHGLLCDHLQSVELVTPEANIVVADPLQRPDLFWACRGGGGGSFGAATRFCFRLLPAPKVVAFGVAWTLPPRRVPPLLKAWQAWAPQAPNVMKADLALFMSQGDRAHMSVRCFGQTTGTETQLRRQLKAMLDDEKPFLVAFHPGSFLGALDFLFGDFKPKSSYAKVALDYVTSPIGDDGVLALVEGVTRSPGIAAICEAYGGKIGDVAAGDTAFPHRAGTLYCIQYAMTWHRPAETPARLASVRSLRASMRPYVSGGSYVNYCDLDIADFANAYWGPNLARLKKIKTEFDPENVFRHAQSIPLES